MIKIQIFRFDKVLYKHWIEIIKFRLMSSINTPCHNLPFDSACCHKMLIQKWHLMANVAPVKQWYRRKARRSLVLVRHNP